MDDNFVEEQLEMQHKEFMNTAILLGSANLPYPEIECVNNYLLDYNAAEGKRFQRIFPGCQHLDAIEAYGEKCLKKLFRAPDDFHFSFNPISGTQANQIVYNAVLKPNSIILSLALKSGGHMSHLDYLRKYYRVIEYHYNIKENVLDYDEIDYLCKQYHPDMIIAGASSYPLLIRYDLLSKICQKYNCLLLADISHTALYIMEDLHPNPFKWADFITFTTHKTTRGPRGAILAYNYRYEAQIDSSAFSISQGAPIFSQICAKVVMLEVLLKQDRKGYCNKISHLTNLFINEMQKNGVPLWINKTDTHLCILDISNSCISAYEFQNLFEESGIYVNACYLPYNDAIPTGIRCGFMMLSTLDISDSDLKLLADIIVKIIQTKKSVPKEKVGKIMNSYYQKYWRTNYE